MKALLKTSVFCGLTVLGTFALFSGQKARACGPDPYVGSICITAASFCPRQYVLAAGQLISISDYTMTYAVVGSTYGGDDRVTFGVPDLRGREMVHSGTGPGLEEIMRGEYTGWEKGMVPYYYFPSHDHSVDLTKAIINARVYASDHAADLKTPGSNYFANTTMTAKNYASSPSNLTAAGSVTATAEAPSGTLNTTGQTPASTAAQSPVTKLGPQLTLNICVAVDGLFPPRQ